MTRRARNKLDHFVCVGDSAAEEVGYERHMRPDGHWRWSRPLDGLGVHVSLWRVSRVPAKAATLHRGRSRSR